MHVVDDESEYLPALHSMHVAGDDAPKVLEYVPTPHGVHDVDANAMAAYVPPAHVKQTVDALPEA